MYGPNERVRWKHRNTDPNVDPTSLIGKVTKFVPDDEEYLVRWDDGTEEWTSAGDLEREP